MSFKDALWDASDPLYSPLTRTVKGRVYWQASAKFRALGYEPANVALDGMAGDGMDLARAAEARRLTRAMLEHYRADRDHPAGTWAWLIARYQLDQFSPYHDVKANTRKSYAWQLERWSKGIGHMSIGAMDYERVRRTQADMIAKGRSLSYVKRMFTTLRIVAGYGKAIEVDAAARVSSILSEVKFRSAPKRTVAPTRAQILAIVDEADARGMFAFATGLLIQWVFAVRAVDVRGQWLEIAANDKDGGIIRTSGDKRLRWHDGLTWNHVDADLTAFTKVISKTSRSLPEPTRFSLTDAAEIRGRLRLLGNGKRVGPVIISERLGMPYTIEAWGRAFARLRDHLGLPKEITSMDTRAGALTEGSEMGADLMILRDGAGHMNSNTTNRYLRSREENIGKLVRLRSAEKP